MKDIRLSSLVLSQKLFLTAVLSIIQLIYLTLVFHIWIDTQLKPSLVAEAYGFMEYIEITHHAHLYLPYYSLFLFVIPVALLMLSSYGENLKRSFAVFPFLVIVIDIVSMYLIPYLWTGFAWVLWLAGTILGISLVALFLMLLNDIWLRKAPALQES